MKSEKEKFLLGFESMASVSYRVGWPARFGGPEQISNRDRERFGRGFGEAQKSLVAYPTNPPRDYDIGRSASALIIPRYLVLWYLPQ
jgi:hypothetical protein